MDRVTKHYCAFQFFFNLLLWIPIFYEFQKKIGLSDPEIFAIQSIYYLSFCIFEIPTGFIADRWGYRQSLRLGAMGLVIANFLPIASPEYFGCLAHFLLIAVARSLISGAASAYLYEYLQQSNIADSYKKIEGTARAYGLFGKVLCWAGVGYLMAWNIFLPYWLTAANALWAFYFATKLPSLGTLSQEKISLGAIQRSFSKAIKSVFVSRLLPLLMLQGVGVFVLARVCQANLYQPILRDKAFSIETYGWIMSLMTICEAFGALRAHTVRRYLSDLNAVFLATFVISLCLSWVAIATPFYTIVAFCLFSLACGIAFPIQKQLLNDHIQESKLRATILSVESIVDRGVASIVLLPMGGWLSQGQLHNILHISAWLIFFVMLCVYLLLWQRLRKEK